MCVETKQTTRPSHSDEKRERSQAGDNRVFWLASRSPRRRQLLQEHGIKPRVIEPYLDDGSLIRGHVSIEQWTAALAYLKAESVVETVGEQIGSEPKLSHLIIGADTLVESDGRIIGQPKNVDHAREIITQLRDSSHTVTTGVAILDMASGNRTFLTDIASVTVGSIDEAEIDHYLESGLWKGKAGAYNLQDRIDAGWPIEYEGDPATIMGLPIRKLVHLQWIPA